MRKVKFVFGIHNHQPIGNFDFVFEEAYHKSYLPFLEVLKRHPRIRIAIHFTGILLDWIEDHYPELLQMIKEMVASGQLEIMSGAYYEPIISVIPTEDRIGQINKLSERAKKLFGYEPSGMWLAERIWEPTLPSTLHDAGLKYTVIDDTHFKYAGLTDTDLSGYFITEELGKSIFLFPINKHLRYTIPFQHPDETIKLLRSFATEEGENVIVFADDGEKFGVWPETHQHVFTNGWLEHFFKTLEDNLDWIEMYHFDEVIQQVRPRGSIYLPTASYAEMMHWALFPKTFRSYEDFEHYLQNQGVYQDVQIFVRGGFWRNFMTKYPEVNVMHKKMLRVSKKLWAAHQKKGDVLKQAFDQLWAGQCNCPYWHGVFGGLYLSHLRHAIFNSLINAEKTLDGVVKNTYPIVEISDFDVDGQDEVLVETALHNAYFKPDKGAAMFEYDFKPVAKNILDTLSRREEGYHHKLQIAKLANGSNASDQGSTASIHDLILTKEPGLEKYLNYDWYEHKSLIDHFFDQSATPESFIQVKYNELGDFVNQPYQLITNKKTKEKVILTFSRNGHIRNNGQIQPVSIKKTVSIHINSTDIDIDYELTNNGEGNIAVDFGVEFNFGLQAGHADDRYYYDRQGKLENYFLDSLGEINDQDFLGLRDEYMKIDITLHSNKKATIWRMPVETVSLSEAGFERVYQSSLVLFKWHINLSKSWKVSFSHKTRVWEK